jgi:hypothetical protein
MNVERTMEFILEQQARNAVEHAKFERGLESLRKLVLTGMKMMVKLQQEQREDRKEWQQGMRELRQESAATKAELRALIRALLRQHPNGGKRRQ